MKKKYTKKQITEAIAYWKKQLDIMDESQKSDQFHRLQSYTDLENKETAECALMFKVVDDGKKAIYRWFPYDEIYDAFFDGHWYLVTEIDDSDKDHRLTHNKVKKYIDDIYGV